MKIEVFLSQAGDSPLRNIPMGSIVADMAELILHRTVDGSATASSIMENINLLSEADRAQFLNKELSNDLKQYESWTALKSAVAETPKAKNPAVYLLIGIISLLTVFFGGLLGYEYITNGKIPTEDSLLIVFGLPVGGIFVLYGTSSEAFTNAMLNFIIKRYSK